MPSRTRARTSSTSSTSGSSGSSRICDCAPAPAACRRSTRISAAARREPPEVTVILPHHILLEVLSFLETRAIVRARGVARAFVRDAPLMVKSLQFASGDKFPAASQMHLFSRVAEVHLDGDTELVQDAAVGLPWCAALRRLRITRKVPQQTPLSGAATASLCGLQVWDIEVCRVRLAVPMGLAMPAWRTLGRLVLRDAFICDESLANLMRSLPRGPLPLRGLDLSRNPFGEMAGMNPMADALTTFPELASLELTADRISSDGAKRVLGALLDGACAKLVSLEMSLNFLDDGVMDFLAIGLERDGHGLQSLQKLGIGGRFSADEGVTNFETLARGLAAGGLPQLNFLHVQGDVGPPEVGPLLREFKRGACSELAIVKVERSTRFHPAEDADSTEDAVQSMWELVTCPCVPRLREVHVLGMNLGKGLEWAQEERTAFYRARNESSFHRLALAGANRGVMIFV